MSSEQLTHAGTTESDIRALALVGSLNADITTQNDLYAEVSENVSHIEFQDAVHNHISEAQSSTLRNLIELNPSYDRIVEQEKQLRAKIGQLDQRISAITQAGALNTTSIEGEKDYILSKLPSLETEIGVIASQIVQRMDSDAERLLGKLVSSRDELRANLTKAESVLYGEENAWALPHIASVPESNTEGAPRRAEFTESDLEIDAFPTEKPILTPAEVVANVRKKYEGRLDDASEFIGLILAEQPGSIYSLDELAALMYDASEENAKSRVSALISNYELGKVSIIGDTLSASSLVFQRGERKQYNPITDTAFGRGHPVFRATDPMSAATNERIIHAIDSGESKIDYDWKSVQVTEAELQTTLGAAPQPTEKYESDTESEFTEAEGETREDAITSIQSQTTASDKEQIAPWQIEFQHSIDETITTLADAGLLSAQELSWATIARISASARIGTKTMAERAVSNKILSRRQARQDTEITPVQLIAMALQNSNPRIFDTRARRNTAIKMIEKSFRTYQDTINREAVVANTKS